MSDQYVSVPRELLDVLRFWLERAAEKSEAGEFKELIQLRELLRPAPAEHVRAVGEEPVAYADPKSFENFNNLAHLGGLYTHEWMWAQPAAGLVPLYRHPQRPVVLPERYERLHVSEYRAGWNACIDEFERLNK